MATRQATVDGHPLTLTAIEEAVFFILARHAGRLVPWPRLLSAIWGTDAASKIGELRVYIAQLRRKLEEHGGSGLILGDGRVGYSLALSAEHEHTKTETLM
jgi:two-component system KDP operon response regulator KdpE